MEDAKLRIIKDRKKIGEFYTLFNNDANFTIDTSFHDIDSRIRIEFKSNGTIIEAICWSPTGLVERVGKVFRYNKNVEDFLLNEKLIIKVIKNWVRAPPP